MKVIAFVTATAALALGQAEAETQGMHLRIHVRSPQKVAQWGQCKWADHSAPCDDGLLCVETQQGYGQCFLKTPKTWEQCGGHSTSGPWSVNCSSPGDKCVYLGDWYSQCQNTRPRERHQKVNKKSAEFSTGFVNAHAKLHEQCKGATGYTPCEKGLQCVAFSDNYGRCHKKTAVLWETCGGSGWKNPWSAACEDSVCVRTDEWYSQCRPTWEVTTTTTTTTTVYGKSAPVSGAKLWDQCGGASFSGSTSCPADSQCVKHSNDYSQCKPNQLPVGELCGEDDQPGGIEWKLDSCANGATCQKTSSTEFRCKK